MKKDLKYYMSLNYPVEVKKLSSEDGGGFYVSIPQLGKYAFHADGETLDKAFESLENVKEFLFEQYLKNEILIHEPITINETEYSGKFVMRVPKQLHRILVSSAKKEGISLNQYVQFLLTSATVTKSFENIIDNYNNKFNRMLKNYEDVYHHYEGINYNMPSNETQELTLITKTEYAEAV